MCGGFGVYVFVYVCVCVFYYVYGVCVRVSVCVAPSASCGPCGSVFCGTGGVVWPRHHSAGGGLLWCEIAFLQKQLLPAQMCYIHTHTHTHTDPWLYLPLTWIDAQG